MGIGTATRTCVAISASIALAACGAADEAAEVTVEAPDEPTIDAAMDADDGWITLFDGGAPENLEVWIARKGLFSFGDQEVFSLTDDGLIQVYGPEPGTIDDALLMTKDSVVNYHFVLEYKWGTEQFNRRDNLPTSGILYQLFGEPGPADPADTSIARYGSAEEIGFTIDAENPPFPLPNGDDFGGFPRGALYQMRQGEAGAWQGAGGASGGPHDSLTDWNVAEIIVEDGRTRHLINGEEGYADDEIVVLDEVTFDTVTLTSGRVGIQAKGSEFYIRSIKIKPL
ncbi:MAG: DUF1080 domain-containing protein [Pseudomonadota bacterium]